MNVGLKARWREWISKNEKRLKPFGLLISPALHDP
jgi:hypothetical protein